MSLRTLKFIPILRIFSIEKTRELYLDDAGFHLDREHRFEPTSPLHMRRSRNRLAQISASLNHGSGSNTRAAVCNQHLVRWTRQRPLNLKRERSAARIDNARHISRLAGPKRNRVECDAERAKPHSGGICAGVVGDTEGCAHSGLALPHVIPA